MTEILGIVAAIAVVVAAAGGAVREIVRDGYGRRVPTRTPDWSPDLPSRPYREV